MRKRSLILISLALVIPLLVTITAAQEGEEHGPPTLAIGSAAPDFCLKGVDGQTHCLKDYASSRY